MGEGDRHGEKELRGRAEGRHEVDIEKREIYAKIAQVAADLRNYSTLQKIELQ